MDNSRQPAVVVVWWRGKNTTLSSGLSGVALGDVGNDFYVLACSSDWMTFWTPRKPVCGLCSHSDDSRALLERYSVENRRNGSNLAACILVHPRGLSPLQNHFCHLLGEGAENLVCLSEKFLIPSYEVYYLKIFLSAAASHNEVL